MITMAFDAFAFVSREIQRNESRPSKRTVKLQGHRTERKKHNSSLTTKAVGGYSNTIDATYKDADTLMCNVITRELKVVTTFTEPEYKVPEGQWLGRAPAI